MTKDKDFQRVMDSLSKNHGWSNIEILPDSYRDLLNDTIIATKELKDFVPCGEGENKCNCKSVAECGYT